MFSESQTGLIVPSLGGLARALLRNSLVICCDNGVCLALDDDAGTLARGELLLLLGDEDDALTLMKPG